MTKKLGDSNTAPETLWTIMKRLLYHKKSPSNTASTFRWEICFRIEKQTFSITFSLLYAHLQIIQASYHLFHIEKAAGLILFMLLKMIY